MLPTARSHGSSSAPAPLHAGARLDWMDAVRGLAIIGILLNHAVEAFGFYAWFTNPGKEWPDLSWRLSHFFPADLSFPTALIVFLGWLGDSAPGVFIILSGFGLAWSTFASNGPPKSAMEFYRSRAARILPLYILVHVGTLALAAFLPNAAHSFEDTKVAFSLLGLRFSHDLFFFINPSWWFIWLIIQFYLVFPLLFRVQRSWGPGRFFLAALLITVASRAYGLTLEADRYYWLTGMFAGSRLAEFALGMVAAEWLAKRLKAERVVEFNQASVLAWALPTYAAGLACSLFLPTVVVSNFLTSAGLLGMGYAASRAIRSISPAGWRVLSWIGAVSFGVFLVHQAPMLWAVDLIAGASTWEKAVAVVAVLALSFPAARACEWLVDWWRHKAGVNIVAWIAGVALPVLCALILLFLLMIEPQLGYGWKRDIFASGLGCTLFLIAAVAWRWPPQLHKPLVFLPIWAAFTACALKLFVLPTGSGPVSVVIGLVAGTLCCLSLVILKRAALALVLGAASTVFALLVAELFLGKWHPIEAGKWGEYPALTAHASRIYALKPSLSVHLKYNNYDYVLRTNADGLAMGDVTPSVQPDVLRILVLGNAFTMPEAVAYEHSWTYLLNEALNKCMAPRKVQVINAGVTGYSPPEKAPQFRELSQRYKPAIVLDQFFTTELEWMTWSRERMLKDIGLIESTESSVRELLERTQVLAHLNLAQEEFASRVTGHIAPWRFGRALLKYHDTERSDIYSEARKQQLLTYYRTLAGEADALGAKLAVVYVPTAISVADLSTLNYLPFPNGQIAPQYDVERPWREFAQVADTAQLTWFDLSEPLRRAAKLQPYFPDSWHWTQAGHQVAAKAVAANLSATGLVPANCGASETLAEVRP